MKEGLGFHHEFPFLACNFTFISQQQMMPLHFQVSHRQALSASTFSCPGASWPWWGWALMKFQSLAPRAAWQHPLQQQGCLHSQPQAPQALTGMEPSGFWLSSPCWDCSQTHQCTHYHTWFPNLHIRTLKHITTARINNILRNAPFHSQALQKRAGWCCGFK